MSSGHEGLQRGDFLQKLIPHLMDVWEHPELVEGGGLLGSEGGGCCLRGLLSIISCRGKP